MLRLCSIVTYSTFDLKSECLHLYRKTNVLYCHSIAFREDCLWNISGKCGVQRKKAVLT